MIEAVSPPGRRLPAMNQNRSLRTSSDTSVHGPFLVPLSGRKGKIQPLILRQRRINSVGRQSGSLFDGE